MQHDNPRPGALPVRPTFPPTQERVVYVGPGFGTILGAILTAWVIVTVLGLVLFYGILMPSIDNQAECMLDNLDRSEAGQPRLPC